MSGVPAARERPGSDRRTFELVMLYRRVTPAACGLRIDGDAALLAAWLDGVSFG